MIRLYLGAKSVPQALSAKPSLLGRLWPRGEALAHVSADGRTITIYAMAAGHKFLEFILPARVFAALEAGTRRYLLECPCGHKRDLCEAGGVKYKGTEQFTWTKGPKCWQRKWHKKRKKTAAELEQF